MTIFNVISLAGGLALFLYGMSIMGTGLEKYAGGRMESILQKLTSSTWRAVALGAVITALIQSSSGTTVIVVGLVNSGIMQLSQAIGIIMGANIGTTVTGQIIRLSDISGGGMLMEFLKPATFAPILAFVGAVLFVFIKSPRKRDIGQIFMGFGLLFIGMGMMTDSVSTLRESELFVRLFTSDQALVPLTVKYIRRFCLCAVPLAAQYTAVDMSTALGRVRHSLFCSVNRKVWFTALTLALPVLLGAADAAFWAEPIVDLGCAAITSCLVFTTLPDFLRRRELEQTLS